MERAHGRPPLRAKINITKTLDNNITMIYHSGMIGAIPRLCFNACPIRLAAIDSATIDSATVPVAATAEGIPKNLYSSLLFSTLLNFITFYYILSPRPSRPCRWIAHSLASQY